MLLLASARASVTCTARLNPLWPSTFHPHVVSIEPRFDDSKPVSLFPSIYKDNGQKRTNLRLQLEVAKCTWRSSGQFNNKSRHGTSHLWVVDVTLRREPTISVSCKADHIRRQRKVPEPFNLVIEFLNPRVIRRLQYLFHTDHMLRSWVVRT